MRTSGLRFTRTLRRALVLPAVLFMVATAYLVGVTVHHGNEAQAAVRAGTADETATVWPAAWSRRFPGCVALVLWPDHETPRAVLLRDESGGVTPMTVRDAAMRLRLAGPADEVRLVGACR